MDIRRKEIIKGKAGADDEGVRVKCKVAKNKVAPPYKVAEFDMIFGMGISGLGCMLDAADEMGVIERRGSWYSYGEERLGQGREKAMEYMTENLHVLESVEADVRRVIAEKLAGKYGAPIDKQAKEVAPRAPSARDRRRPRRRGRARAGARRVRAGRRGRSGGALAPARLRSGGAVERRRRTKDGARLCARRRRGRRAQQRMGEKIASVCLSCLSVLRPSGRFFNR